MHWHQGWRLLHERRDTISSLLEVGVTNYGGDSSSDQLLYGEHVYVGCRAPPHLNWPKREVDSRMLVADLLRLEGEGVAFNLEDVFVIEGTLPEELRAEHHWSCPLFLGDDQPHNLSLGLSLGIFRTEPYPKGDTNADMAVCAKSLFSEVYPAEAPFAEGVLPALGAGDSRFSLRA